MKLEEEGRTSNKVPEVNSRQ